MYDPTVGRFLEEDPVGFFGEDLNLLRYCDNGPNIAVDPTGLYYTDIHFYFTYYLARYLCFDRPAKVGNSSYPRFSEAYLIAWMNQMVDEGQNTRPRMDINSAEARAQNRRYHFPGYGGAVVEDDVQVQRLVLGAANSWDLAQFGVAMHVYMDTFAHSNYDSVVGHGHVALFDWPNLPWSEKWSGKGTSPDRPYWDVESKAKAKRMAKAMYAAMRRLACAMGRECCDGKPRSFDDFWRTIEPTLFREGTNKERVLGWKSLIRESFGRDVSFGLDDNDPWMQTFLDASKGIPEWDKNRDATTPDAMLQQAIIDAISTQAIPSRP